MASNPDRGTGITTRQLRDAPHGAYYVWVSGQVGYVKDLAVRLGRSDLVFISPDDAARGYVLRGSRHPVVVDHAANLSHEAWDRIKEHNAMIAHV